MSLNVAVYNDNIYPYAETFHDQLITIPARGHVVMPRSEAVLFLRTMNKIMTDADGNPLPQSYKKLRIIESQKNIPQEAKAPEFTCNACAKSFSSQEMLDDHILDTHVDMIADEGTKAEMKKGKTKGTL